jgi:hypothetical protein
MGMFLVFFSNIGLGWKWLPLTNALAYSAVDLITTLKSFILQVEFCLKEILKQSIFVIGGEEKGGQTFHSTSFSNEKQ